MFFGLWCAGTRAWWWSTAGGRVRPLASNPEPRRELNGKACLLVYATKPIRWTAVKTPSRGGTAVGLGMLTEGQASYASRALLRARRDRHQTTSRAVKKPRWEWHLRPRHGGRVLPTRRFWRFSQNQPPTGFAGPTKTAGVLIRRNTWRHRGGSIDAKQSLQGVITIRWKDLYLSNFAPTGLLV